MRKIGIQQIGEYLEKIEVLSEMYNELGAHPFERKSDLEIAKLKMNLIKKEILMLSYQISRQLEQKC